MRSMRRLARVRPIKNVFWSIEIDARRIHYWDGEDEGEVKLPVRATA